jgi:hypothetical protein
VLPYGRRQEVGGKEAMMGDLRRRRLLIGLANVALVLASVDVALPSETKSNEPPSYPVGRAKAAPIVDGRLDDPVWDGVRQERLAWDVDAATPWGESADTQATFRAVWREGRVYMALAIGDDRLDANPRKPDLSDRLEIYLMRPYAPPHRRYTVPVRETGSVEDANVPFAAWRADGKACEFSLETTAMYDRVPELRFNIYYADVDGGRPRRRIGWVPQAEGSRNPQFGTLLFGPRLGAQGKLETTWGKVKTLYQ